MASSTNCFLWISCFKQTTCNNAKDGDSLRDYLETNKLSKSVDPYDPYDPYISREKFLVMFVILLR